MYKTVENRIFSCLRPLSKNGGKYVSESRTQQNNFTDNLCHLSTFYVTKIMKLSALTVRHFFHFATGYCIYHVIIYIHHQLNTVSNTHRITSGVAFSKIKLPIYRCAQYYQIRTNVLCTMNAEYRAVVGGRGGVGRVGAGRGGEDVISNIMSGSR